MARVYFQRARGGYRPVRGEVVRQVQVELKAAGSNPGEIDGIYGSGTESAIMDFQRMHGIEADGKITDEVWTRLMGAAPPAILDRCLQLTGDFEGHGFQKVAGNFDGAGLTWGIIGFTLYRGEIGRIMEEIRQNFPDLINQAFGDLAHELFEVLGKSRAEQIDWANGISIGPGKYRVKRPWEKAFKTLGSFPDVQAVQLRRVRPYWDIALRDAERFGLTTERGIALCFDIAVQNGGIDDDEERQIRRRLADHPGASERDTRILIADVVAENSSPQYMEDVRQRKMTIATGEGVVHGAWYATMDWGIAEYPWET